MSATATEDAEANLQTADRRARLVAAGCASTALLITGIALAGYTTGRHLLSSFLRGAIPMRPNAAACALLCATAVLLLVIGGRRLHRIAQGFAGMVLAVAGLTACEYLFGVNLGIDNILLMAVVQHAFDSNAGRMSHLAVFEFLFLGCAILLLARRRSRSTRAAQTLGALVSFTGILGILAYTFRAETFYSAGLTTEISLPTTLASTMLGGAVMLLQARQGWMQVVLSPSAGGIMLRRLLPIAILVPWILARLSVAGAKAGYYGQGSDQLFFAAPLIVIMVLMLLRNALLLDRVDRERSLQSEQVNELNRDLENRVELRTQELASANTALQMEIAEHHRTERELHDKERQLRDKQLYTRSLIESSIDALATISTDSLITDVNQQMESLTGCARAELIGTPFRQYFTDPERAEAGVRLVLEQSRVTDYELTARSRDGRQTPVACNASTYYNQQQKLQGVFAAARDISERKRAEESLRLQADQYATMLATSADGFWRFDLNGKLLDVNDAYCRMSGYSRQELLTLTIPQIEAIETPADVADHIRRVTKSGFDRFESQHRAKDGHILDAEVSVSYWRPAAQMILFVRDITGRKRAQRALRLSEERYRSLTIATTQIVWTTDVGGEVVEDLSGWRAFTGMSSDEIKGSGWINAVHPEDRERTAEAWSRAVKDRILYEVEYRLRRHDGEYRNMWARGVPVLEADGSIREWIGTCADVTDRKLAEQELRRAHDELELRVQQRTAELAAANAELEAFSYSVSHDLRAPLRHVDSFARLLVEHCGPSADKETTHYLDRIRSGAQRMAQLIDDLLNLSGVGRQAMRYESTDLAPLVHAIVREFDTGERKLEWKVGPLPTVRCDAALMKQVFDNLLSNAVKFTSLRDRAVIEVGQTVNEGKPVFYVRDNGIGFDMKYADKLFGAFQRLHPPEQFPGTGVGLATVKRIISKHGGQVWAEAAPDRGATFYFTLGAGLAEPQAEWERTPCVLPK